MTIESLLADIDREIRHAEAAQKRARANVEQTIKAAQNEGRSNLTAEEDGYCEDQFTEFHRQDEVLEALKGKRARAEAVKAEEDASNAAMREVHPVTRERGAKPAYDQVMRVGQEARTYRPDTDPRGTQFLNDIIADATNRGRGGASERLERHFAEQRVDYPHLQERGSGVGTAAFSGLVVPQYLVDMVAPSISNLRPLANIANHHDLPQAGMSVNISRITTATSAALQTNELTAVSWTDADDTLLTVPVLTAAGQQLISRQAIERGAGVEDTLTEDLLRQVATQVDYQMINQTVTGALAVGQNIVYTQASPTADTTWPVLFQMESKLEKTLMGIATPDYVLMRSDRWNWITSQVSANHPWVAQNGTVLQGGIQLSNDYGTVNHTPIRGRLANGMPVVVDNNLPNNVGTGTNEDRILIVASREAHIWEDRGSPVMIRAEQPYAANLGVLLVAYEYFAYTFGRYANNPAYCSGTGMVVTTALANF